LVAGQKKTRLLVAPTDHWRWRLHMAQWTADLVELCGEEF
jgi:hypothetical protein